MLFPTLALLLMLIPWLLACLLCLCWMVEGYGTHCGAGRAWCGDMQKRPAKDSIEPDESIG
jgi:hypothetical protein